MNISNTNIAIYLSCLLLPTICSAGELSKGTVIMISSVSGWLLLSSGFLLWKEVWKDGGRK